jgi:hypothetical protein
MNFDELIADLDADGFGYYLAGLIDGEGSFAIGHTANCQCLLTINLRDDDADILYEIQRRTGIGRVRITKSYENSTRQRTPLARWAVGNHSECALLVRLLERYPLRAKKRRDFEIWRRAVQEWITRTRSSGWEPMLALRAELMAVRQYAGPAPSVFDCEVAASTRTPSLFDA